MKFFTESRESNAPGVSLKEPFTSENYWQSSREVHEKCHCAFYEPAGPSLALTQHYFLTLRYRLRIPKQECILNFYSAESSVFFAHGTQIPFNSTTSVKEYLHHYKAGTRILLSLTWMIELTNKYRLQCNVRWVIIGTYNSTSQN